MNEQQKQAVLANINFYEVSELHQFIIDGEFTIEDFIATGRLPRAKEKDLRGLIGKVEDEVRMWRQAQSSGTIEAYNLYVNSYPNGRYIELARAAIKTIQEEQAWENCKFNYDNCSTDINSLQKAIKSFQNYQSQFPSGVYYEQASSYITDLNFKIAELKRQEIEKMRRNPEKYTKQMFEKWFADETFSPSDLIESGLITEQGLALYMNPPNIFMPEQEWGQINALPDGSTDVYFFGIPRSGKSCVIAGLLYQADKEGVLKPDIDNGKGYRYMNELQKSVRLGYVPPSTPGDKMNYINFDLKGRKRHPISLIEMSGEYVDEIIRNIYDGVITDTTKNLMKCMSNDNRKALFFVVDYSVSYNFDFSEDQSAKLTGILQFLQKNGILSKTDSLQIVVTKSDMMPDGDRMETASDFLRENYRTFVNNAEGYCQQYGINRNRGNKPVLVPFSLGEFMLGKVYKYDKSSSLELIQILLNMTHGEESEPGWLDKIFKILGCGKKNNS